MQYRIDDFPLQKYWCPIKREWFKDSFAHQRQCIYKYCKSGWLFTKGLI